MRNVETAIFPLILALCICGLCVFEYPKGQPRLFLTILYTLTSWLLYIYLVVQMKPFMEKNNIGYVPTYFTIVIALFFMILNVYYYKRFKTSMKKLDIVNDTLVELGTLRNHAQLRARTLWLIIGWIISICGMNLLDSLWLLVHSSKEYAAQCIYLPFLISYSFHIIVLNGITFLILLRYVGTLFECVSQCIQTLIEQKKRQVRLAWTTCTSSSFMHRHVTDTTKSNQLVCLLMHVHFEISFISRELNTIFGLQIMMQMSLYHIYAVQFIIKLCVVLANANFTNKDIVNISCIFLWSVRCILEIIVLNSICDGLCMKANRAEMFLNKLANLTFHVETQENITQFLLQILRRPLRITALGFYDYGYKFVQTFILRAMQIIMIALQTR